MKPRLLDAFSGAGGAGYGYHLAGFDVVGVDLAPMPRYPFEFHQADALTFLAEHGHEFDAIHASPPCQAYSAMSACRPGLSGEYPALIEPVRELLDGIGRPYVIENVVGAPLLNPVMLCGWSLGLDLYRHRLFECSGFPPPLAWHMPHTKRASRAGHWEPGTVISVAGNCAPISVARAAMGIDWMTRAEIAEAIPPAYCEFIGASLLDQLAERAA